MSKQKPIADNLFTWPSDSPKLIGSKDTETGRYFFPARSSNHHERVELSNRGKLWTWTVQRFLPKTPFIDQVAPEDFKPYAVGYIELPGDGAMGLPKRLSCNKTAEEMNDDFAHYFNYKAGFKNPYTPDPYGNKNTAVTLNADWFKKHGKCLWLGVTCMYGSGNKIYIGTNIGDEDEKFGEVYLNDIIVKE